MKHVADLLREMGFNKDSPESTQKALIQSALRNLYGNHVGDISPKILEKNQRKKEKEPEQLSLFTHCENQ